jgi:trehalose-phosphatase
MREPERLAELVIGRAGALRLLLLFDFDGTLCEFEADPAAVRLTPRRRTLLAQLARDHAVGVVSGRRLHDIRERCGGEGIALAGAHGMEIDAFGERFVHPGLASAAKAIEAVTRALRALAAPLPGAFVEEKGTSVALHFRTSAVADQQKAADGFSAAAAPYLHTGCLRLMRGSNVLELLPDIDWNKGHAVRWIQGRARERIGPLFTVYLGDDVTDQDAFAAVLPDGLPIAVSARVHADTRLDGPGAVEHFMRSLVSGP